MKNTTFKKKALISSIAMLLVALVALGSATFAWFAANPNATTSGLTMRTTAAAGLVVKTDSDGTWSHNAKLYNGVTEKFLLTPVSEDQDNPANFWTTPAADSSNYVAGSEAMTSVTPGTYQSTGALYSEKIYFALTSGSDATAEASKSVKLASMQINGVSGANLINAINVAMTDDQGELLGTWEVTTAGDHGTLVTADKTPQTFDPAVVVASSVNNFDTGINSLPIQAATSSKFVTVYVYLDGQDETCKSEGLSEQDAEEIISGITLNWTLS